MFFAEAANSAGNSASAWTHFLALLESAFELIRTQSTEWCLRGLAALLIFAVGRRVARLIALVAGKTLAKTHVTPTVGKFLTRFINVILQTVVLVAVLQCIGVETASIVAMLAAASFAIGMALQGSLSNFAAGILIVVLRPFHVGDTIEAAGVTGTVEEIGIFGTLLCTGDHRQIHVPNSVLTSQTVTNISAKPTRRIDLVVGIGYGDDIKKAKDIIAGILAAETRVLPLPAPLIAVSNLGESSVDLSVRPWVRTVDYWPVRFALIEKIKTGLEAGGCSIPYPQRDVHILKMPTA